jgi:hypothetical protein
MLDKNKNSKHFVLGSGRPQGDNLSPITFNFCEQILIFKIELDPRIEKIPYNILSRVQSPSPFSFESNRETVCNESLADDNTILTLMTRNSLEKIRETLLDFEKISGLCCNYDKTVLMPVFEPTNEEKIFSDELGFRIVNSIHLLGMDITPNFTDISKNFTKIKKKILLQVRFWERFKLSLPGRLSIAKTFLVSQLNYLGCVFSVPDSICLEIQEIINNFIRKNLKIAKDRICTSAEKGGLGFFDLRDFLSAQRCCWIFRAKKHTIDNWRHDLFEAAPGNDILKIKCVDINRNLNPALYDIVCDYEKFYTAFSKSGKNFEKSYIFENQLFAGSENPSTGIGINFFGNATYNANKLVIRNFKYCDCFSGARFKTHAEFAADIRGITVNSWMRIRNVILKFKSGNFIKQVAQKDTCLEIADFSNSLKKGSRKIQGFL